MAATDVLGQNTAIQDLMRRVKQLETGTPMNSAAVGSGGIRVHSGGVINIENGGLVVNGSATIIGTLNADGTINMTGLFVATGTVRLNGPTSVTGDFTVTGPTKLNGKTDVAGDLTVTGPTKLNGKTDIGGNTSVTGDLDVKGPLTVTGATKLNGKTDIGGNTSVDGTLDIKGKSTLQNDLEVRSNGKVKVGGMTLDPTVASGAVTFSNGAQLFTNGSSIQMFRGNGVVQVDGDSASIQWGGNSFTADDNGRRVSNLPRTDKQPNLYVDGSGYLHRSSWEPPE